MDRVVVSLLHDVGDPRRASRWVGIYKDEYILYRDKRPSYFASFAGEKFLTRAAYLAALGKKFREPIESLIECLDQIT